MKASQPTLEIPPDLSHLPDTVGALVPLYRACIVRFDAAVRARDLNALADIYAEADELIERAHSLPRFAGPCARNPHGFRYCFMDVAEIFDRLTRAVPGTVPLFGQSGDFVASLSTVKIRFKVDGICGSIGTSAYDSTVWSFSINAVERDRSFLSETGYRSFMCCSLGAGELGDDVARWCLGHVRHWWNGEGGKPSKYALVRIAPRPAAPVFPVEDEDEDEGALDCVTCGADLSQMDAYGECEDDGAAYCPACYSEHEKVCADCLPLDGEPDDDGRTAMGSGYRSEPVAKTSTQLSLF